MEKNVIWPYSNHIIPSQLDHNYESAESMTSEASYIALMNGYIQENTVSTYLSKDIVNYNHSTYDEFRFLRKFFNPFWSFAYLAYRAYL